MNIFINPGHDRELDSGAVSPIDGTREADVVAELGALLAAALQAAGQSVQLLQSDELSAVAAAANNWPADIFLSLHCNASYTHTASGLETLYRSEQGKILATAVQAAVLDALPLVDRGCKQRKDLYVLNATSMPALLVELGFIDSKADLPLLKNSLPVYASALSRGIGRYMEAVK